MGENTIIGNNQAVVADTADNDDFAYILLLEKKKARQEFESENYVGDNTSDEIHTDTSEEVSLEEVAEDRAAVDEMFKQIEADCTANRRTTNLTVDGIKIRFMPQKTGHGVYTKILVDGEEKDHREMMAILDQKQESYYIEDEDSIEEEVVDLDRKANLQMTYDELMAEREELEEELYKLEDDCVKRLKVSKIDFDGIKIKVFPEKTKNGAVAKITADGKEITHDELMALADKKQEEFMYIITPEGEVPYSVMDGILSEKTIASAALTDEESEHFDKMFHMLAVKGCGDSDFEKIMRGFCESIYYCDGKLARKTRQKIFQMVDEACEADKPDWKALGKKTAKLADKALEMNADKIREKFKRG